MVNNLKKCFVSLVVILTMLVPSIVFGADPVYVKINGVLLNFEDAQPQIMNQRAMVPFRRTAEALGATVDWNKTTETATLTKGNRTVVHTMRTNVITVNGVASTFDTPSAVVQNRTMMPVRMLSEALGNVVTWDNSSRTVNIVADQPSIISVVPDKTTVNSGEKVTISVTASSVTDKIKIIDVNENNALITEANTYSTNADGTRLYSIPWTPNVAKSTFKTLKVVAGNSSSYNENADGYKVCAISVTADTTPKITSFSSDKKEVSRDDSVKLTIEANANTEKIKITNAKNEKLSEVTNYKLSDSNNPNSRVFETTIKMTERGDIELRAYPSDNSGNYQATYQTVKITVSGIGSTTSSEKLKISDYYLLDDNIFVDEEVQLIVKTSTDIEKIEILNSDDKVVCSTKYSAIKNTSEYVWDLNVPIKDSGRNRFYIVAYDKDGNSVKESISFSASTYSNNDLEILNIVQKDIGALSGDSVKFVIRTTGKASYLKVFEGSTELSKISSYSSSGSVKEWETKITITTSNKNNLKVIAYDDKDTQVSSKINVYINEKANGKIYDYNVKTPEVYKNEYVRVDVFTNKAISKVWIEDENNVRVAIKTSYDSVSGEEYTWELKFPAEDVGTNIKYTIYAEDENGKKLDQTFRIKVNK